MDIINSTKQNFLKWRHNPRYLIIMVMIFILLIDVMKFFKDITEKTSMNLCPWLLPFFVRDHYILFYLALCIVLLFCDAPFLDNLQLYNIKRIGRFRWMIGQIIYILCCSALLFLSISVLMVFFCIKKISFTSDWGECLKTLAYDNPFIGAFCSEMILNNNAIILTLKTFFICWLVTSFIGILMFYLNLTVGKELCSIIVSSIVTIDFFIYAGGFQMVYLFWISPISWMNPEQYLGDDSWQYPVRIGILIILIVILLILSKINIMKINITSIAEL